MTTRQEDRPEQLDQDVVDELISLYKTILKGEHSEVFQKRYHDRFSRLFQQVAITRNSRTIWFDDNFAVEVPLHKHFTIRCQIPSTYSEVITELVKKAEKAQRSRSKDAVERIKKSRFWKEAAQKDKHVSLKESDVITSETNLVLAQLAFPHLAQVLKNPKWSGFTGTQKQLQDKKWYKMWERDDEEEDPFYGEKDVLESPISEDFDALIKSSSKMKALFQFIDADTNNEKFVLGSSNLPVNTIVAEALRKKYGCNSVEVLNADNPKRAGVKSGEERNAAIEAFKTQDSPQSRFIVVDTRKGAVGFTLDRSYRLVFLVPEFSEIRDQRFSSRCYRVSQKEAVCYTFRLITDSKESKVELFLDMDQQSRQDINTGIWSGELV